MIELSLRHVRKSKKERKCVWCGEAIAIGDPVLKRAYIFEREFSIEYWHAECLDAASNTDEGMEFNQWQQKRGEPLD